MAKAEKSPEQKRVPRLRVPSLRPPKIRPIIKPRRPEIIIGIPTLNEAKTISALVKVLDEGAKKYLLGKRVLMVNADARSSDGTRKAFLGTKTKAQKKCMEVPRGKGKGLKELFGYFLSKETAEALMLVDGDVRSATPRWTRNLVTPILKGFDHAFPLFNRHEFDASITNLVAYPVMRGVMGIDIRQPLAGEVGLSRKAVDRIYNRDWPKKSDRYGVDIFMAFSSVLAEYRIAETYLGVVDHHPSTPDLSEQFEEVMTTMFDLLETNRGFWDGSVNSRKPPIFFKDSKTNKYPYAETTDYGDFTGDARKGYKAVRRSVQNIADKEIFGSIEKAMAPRGNLYLGDELWTRILAAFVKSSGVSPEKKAQALRPLFYARFLSFHKDNMGASRREVEGSIVEFANEFYRSREKLLVNKKKNIL